MIKIVRLKYDFNAVALFSFSKSKVSADHPRLEGGNWALCQRNSPNLCKTITENFNEKAVEAIYPFTLFFMNG